MSLKISVVTPSYNHEQYITDTIESVLRQKYDNFEHIIIDNGSQDNTISVLKRYHHLKWITQKNEGTAKAVNQGAKMATGDILCWVNSDDYLDDDAFSEVNKVISSNPNTELVFGGLTFVDKNKQIISKEETFKFNIDYLINVSADIIKQPASFYSKDLFWKVNGLDSSLSLVYDYDLFLKMLLIISPYFTDKNLAFYRQYSTTQTKSNIRKQSKEIFKISRKYGGKLFSKLNLTNLKKYYFPHKF
jgi:glycosyltransferase involved in cell wall biosynthesis